MKIAVGPLLFGWPESRIQEAYLSFAGEEAVDILYVGEVVCSKRSVSGVEGLIGLARKLQSSGKEVVLSTLAMPTTDDELQAIRDICQAAGEMGLMIEANDMAAVSIASSLGIGFVAGPHLNVYNHGTLDHLGVLGARRVVMPLELPAGLIPEVAAGSEVEVEYFAHGKLPLTFSARCYSARAWGLSKRECRHVCFRHPEGMEMRTLDATGFATINGIQMMSHHSFTVIDHVTDLEAYGVDILRLSPQSEGMANVIREFRMVLEGRRSSQQALRTLSAGRDASEVFCNGYYFGRQGRIWVEATDGA
jgi:collagenase-like PrtC family protease